MPDFNLIKLEGKPIEKLVEVISDGIGTLYRPRAIRKEAESRAYEIEIIEAAKAKASAAGKELEAETYIRIRERNLFSEIERQKNIDLIAEKTAKQLVDEPNVSENPVDKDWTRRFFNIAQDISDDDMQEIWSRILAGEVKAPKSFSIRTLDVVKNLSKEDAELFSDFAKFKITSDLRQFVFSNENEKILEDEGGIDFEDLITLKDCGLIVSAQRVSIGFAESDVYSATNFHLGTKFARFERRGHVPKQYISVIVFTRAGQELSNLIQQEFNLNYVSEFFHGFRHPNVKLFYGDIIESHDGKILLGSKTEIK